jgi:hypothetical protein
VIPGERDLVQAGGGDLDELHMARVVGPFGPVGRVQVLGEQRRDRLDLEEVGGELDARGWLSVTTTLPNSPGGADALDRVAREQDAVGGDRVDRDRAGVAVGAGGADQRAAGADHVVVDHDALAADLGRHAGDRGGLAVDARRL